MGKDTVRVDEDLLAAAKAKARAEDGVGEVVFTDAGDVSRTLRDLADTYRSAPLYHKVTADLEALADGLDAQILSRGGRWITNASEMVRQLRDRSEVCLVGRTRGADAAPAGGERRAVHDCLLLQPLGHCLADCGGDVLPTRPGGRRLSGGMDSACERSRGHRLSVVRPPATR
ncbi:hypothetical protein ACGFX7_06000 [Streptomyces harbinensis]|uniref:hypothetical protein n=1 Tax=Streptomyces harbinensis TaxID=1176198 RepID=UPI003720ADD7